MLESLRIRSFRYQWGADLFATWAAEMETLLLAWYVLVDTGSPFLVGLVGALRFGGLLLAPLYGVLADQVDRRRLLVALRVGQGAQAALFAALAFSGPFNRGTPSPSPGWGAWCATGERGAPVLDRGQRAAGGAAQRDGPLADDDGRGQDGRHPGRAALLSAPGDGGEPTWR